VVVRQPRRKGYADHCDGAQLELAIAALWSKLPLLQTGQFCREMKMRVVRRGERRGAEGITSCGHSPLTPPVLNLLDRVRAQL
jgi:hypothetical protein